MTVTHMPPGPALARVAVDGGSGPDLSIVIPTFNEADNIIELLGQLVRAIPAGLAAEVIFVDDSRDHTPAVIAQAGQYCPLPVRLHHRLTADGGLGGAVIEGFRMAQAPWIVVMDADLQHPPAVVPDLVAAGESAGAELVVASRYAEGGDRGGLASRYRVAVSRLSTVAAKAAFPRRLHEISDPMSGFFAIRRDVLERAAGSDLAGLRPSGYKILLELAVRCAPRHVVEVPFTFRERHAGESKSTLREGIRFVRHLTALRVDDTRTRMLAVALIGLTGFGPNLAAMYLLHDRLGVNLLASAVLANQVAVIWNFLLGDLLVFHYRHNRRWFGRFGRYVLLSNADLVLRVPALGLLVGWAHMNYLVATALTIVAAFLVRFLVTDRVIYVRRPRLQTKSVEA